MQLDNIREIHIEPTSLCNAECPQCARNIHGSGLNPNIQLNSLTINYFTNFFNSDNIKKVNKINLEHPWLLIKVFIYLEMLPQKMVNFYYILLIH